MSNILRKFVNIFNESVDKVNWICGWIQMNSLKNFNEFVNEFKWSHWSHSKQFIDELLINSSEFIDESSWIHWGILVNSVRNSSEFIEES